MSIKVSVFTPTYNRGYILDKLYESLRRQTYQNFEWIVLDDGSTDDTKERVEVFIQESIFPIIYKKVENGGKCKAINRGVEIARGELFFIVDSDDYLTDNALERIIYWEATIADKEKFCGVSGNRGNKNRKLWGTTFQGKYLDCTALERKQNNITGDKAEVYYTKILRKYPFPEFEGERYVPLVYVWQGMAHDGYKIRWFNEIIYIGEYLEDGLTKKYQSLLDRNPKGTAAYKVKECEYFHFTLKEKINSFYQYYTRYRNSLSVKEVAENLQCSSAFMYYIIVRFKFRNMIKGKAYK